jgi:hypothetical protein
MSFSSPVQLPNSPPVRRQPKGVATNHALPSSNPRCVTLLRRQAHGASRNSGALEIIHPVHSTRAKGSRCCRSAAFPLP